MEKKIVTLIVGSALILALSAPAMATGHGHGGHGKSSSPAAGETLVVSANGVVKAIAPSGQSITLNHEPIPALNWPAMTMDLALTDPALAAGLEIGDKIVFDLKRLSATDYVITGIRKGR